MAKAEIILSKILFLREHDTSFEVFGSDHHKYLINPTLTEEEIDDFEKKEAVKLPKSYREYLKSIGNGGAGPSYGIYPLEQARLGAGWLPPIEDFNNKSDEETESPGELLIGHNGCGIFTWLKVVGPSSGELWLDGRANGQASRLMRKDFLEWYESWLDSIFFEKGFITHLSAKALEQGQGGLFKESLESFKLLASIKKREHYNVPSQGWQSYLSALCNVLYFLQQDNTGLPVNAEMNNYFLEKCMPLAEENPAIYFNAACVYNEMKEFANVTKCLDAAKPHEQIYPVMLDTIKREAVFLGFREYQQKVQA